MKLTFIVNGTETIVKAKKKEKMESAVNTALEQTKNNGRPAFDFQIILDDVFLNADYAINNQVNHTEKGERIEDSKIIIDENSVIFLSLKSGVGG